jgi:hypothetical protein
MFETTRIEQLVKGVDYRFYIQDHHNVVVWCLGQGEDLDTSYGNESLESALECYNTSLKAGWQPTQALSLLAEDVQLVQKDIPAGAANQSDLDDINLLLNLKEIINAEIKEQTAAASQAIDTTRRFEDAAEALEKGKVVRVKKQDLGPKIGTELQKLKENIEVWLFVRNNDPGDEVKEKWRVSIAPSHGDYLLRARRV